MFGLRNTQHLQRSGAFGFRPPWRMIPWSAFKQYFPGKRIKFVCPSLVSLFRFFLFFFFLATASDTCKTNSMRLIFTTMPFLFVIDETYKEVRKIHEHNCNTIKRVDVIYVMWNIKKISYIISLLNKALVFTIHYVFEYLLNEHCLFVFVIVYIYI